MQEFLHLAAVNGLSNVFHQAQLVSDVVHGDEMASDSLLVHYHMNIGTCIRATRVTVAIALDGSEVVSEPLLIEMHQATFPNESRAEPGRPSWINTVEHIGT